VIGHRAALCRVIDSPRKNLADDVLNRHFLNVNVGHRQIVEQRFADGNHAVAFDLQGDRARRFFHDFAISRQILRRIAPRRWRIES
jgi:hypothetical protein